jgi:hypothetical protein
VAGLEPVTSAVTGQRSNQLSYTPACGAGERRKRRLASQRYLSRATGEKTFLYHVSAAFCRDYGQVLEHFGHANRRFALLRPGHPCLAPG